MDAAIYMAFNVRYCFWSKNRMLWPLTQAFLTTFFRKLKGFDSFDTQQFWKLKHFLVAISNFLFDQLNEPVVLVGTWTHFIFSLLKLKVAETT